MPSPPKASSSKSASSTSSREKVRQHRERLRQQGLRPIQIWVPDVRTPEFKAEARRQCLIIANSADDAEDQAFIDSLADWGDE